MKSRCDNEANPYYGARHITVDACWDEFENFLADMGKKPAPHYTIERHDVNGGYTPDNCAWVPRADQELNKRTSFRWFVDGVEYRTAKEAARGVKVSKNTVRRWCGAYGTPARENCWRELKYPNIPGQD